MIFKVEHHFLKANHKFLTTFENNNKSNELQSFSY